MDSNRQDIDNRWVFEPQQLDSRAPQDAQCEPWRLILMEGKFIEGGKQTLTGSGSNGRDAANKDLLTENECLKKLTREQNIANGAFKKLSRPWA